MAFQNKRAPASNSFPIVFRLFFGAVAQNRYGAALRPDSEALYQHFRAYKQLIMGLGFLFSSGEADRVAGSLFRAWTFKCSPAQVGAVWQLRLYPRQDLSMFRRHVRRSLRLVKDYSGPRGSSRGAQRSDQFQYPNKGATNPLSGSMCP